MADEPASPFSPVQVASVQTLVASPERAPRADFLVIDECHHWAAEEFRGAADALGARWVVGLTATPERADGRPLGDVFDDLVCACHYSALVGSGVLTPIRILRPAEELQAGLAQDPLEAYQQRGEGRRGFLFTRSIEEARALAARFTQAGVSAEAVDANTPKEQREASIARLRSGETRILTNVYALTEGVDVPEASVCILARGVGHVSQYLQICGRILRAFAGKADALLLDLHGVSHRFGAPIEDRDYSLEGEGIRRKPQAALRVCMHCGFTYEPGPPKCPRCGKTNALTVQEKRAQKILNRELQEKRFGAVPDWQQKAEFQRLQAIARNAGHKPGWVVTTFVRMFGRTPPWPLEVPREERKRQWEALAAKHPEARAMWLYKNMFKQHVPKEWRK